MERAEVSSQEVAECWGGEYSKGGFGFQASLVLRPDGTYQHSGVACSHLYPDFDEGEWRESSGWIDLDSYGLEGCVPNFQGRFEKKTVDGVQFLVSQFFQKKNPSGERLPFIAFVKHGHGGEDIGQRLRDESPLYKLSPLEQLPESKKSSH